MLAQQVPAFRCDVVPDRDGVVVAPQGELDMATVGALEKELRNVRETGFDRIVLDLGGLSFMDSTGIHLVTRWTNQSSNDGFAFEIEPGPPVIQRVFELAQLTDALPFSRSG